MKVFLLCFLVSIGNCWAKKITGYSGIENSGEGPSRELSEKRMWDKAHKYCENNQMPVQTSVLETRSVHATYWHVLVGMYVSADFECTTRNFTIESKGSSDGRYFAYDAERASIRAAVSNGKILAQKKCASSNLSSKTISDYIINDLETEKDRSFWYGTAVVSVDFTCY